MSSSPAYTYIALWFQSELNVNVYLMCIHLWEATRRAAASLGSVLTFSIWSGTSQMELQIECKFNQGLPSGVFYREDSFQFISLSHREIGGSGIITHMKWVLVKSVRRFIFISAHSGEQLPVKQILMKNLVVGIQLPPNVAEVFIPLISDGICIYFNILIHMFGINLNTHRNVCLFWND